MKGRQKTKVEWSKLSLEDRRLMDRPDDFKIYKIRSCLRGSGVVATGNQVALHSDSITGYRRSLDG